MRRWMPGLKVVSGVLVAAALVAAAMWPRAVPVDAATVTRGPLQVTVDEEGETRVRDRFVVSAPVSGRVMRIELEPGDRVERGRTVARLQPGDPVPLDTRTQAEAEAAVRAADAAVAQARMAARLARSEAERYAKLAADGIVSRDILETKETAARTADLAVEEAVHQRELAAARLQQGSRSPQRGAGTVVVRSPIDGVVLRRLWESEAVVTAGTPLLELGDPGRIEIVSDFLSTEAVKIREGAPVLIERWGGEHPLNARVHRVEPYGFLKLSALGVEEQRVNVIVDFEDPHDAFARLGDGYRVEVRVITWQSPDVLQVPTSSLFRRGNGWAVFVIEDGRARVRQVEIGQRNAAMAGVTKGLGAGESVVVHPSDSVADGVRVSVRPGEPR